MSYTLKPSWFTTMMKGVCIGAIVSALIVIALAIAMI